MAVSPQQENLTQWFQWLRSMRSNCTPLTGADLLNFGRANITTTLPQAMQQSQFAADISQDLSIQCAVSDLTTYPTFKGLLDHFMRLEIKVADYLITVASGNYTGLADFYKVKPADAFPGGSTGTVWRGANGVLAGIFAPECYTNLMQTAAAKLVDDPSKKVSDLVKQIATL